MPEFKKTHEDFEFELARRAAWYWADGRRDATAFARWCFSKGFFPPSPGTYKITGAIDLREFRSTEAREGERK